MRAKKFFLELSSAVADLLVSCLCRSMTIFSSSSERSPRFRSSAGSCLVEATALAAPEQACELGDELQQQWPWQRRKATSFWSFLSPSHLGLWSRTPTPHCRSLLSLGGRATAQLEPRPAGHRSPGLCACSGQHCPWRARGVESTGAGREPVWEAPVQRRTPGMREEAWEREQRL
jgi:hypothetical protein